MKEIIHLLENLVMAKHPVWLTFLISLFIMILAFILSPSAGVKLIDIFVSKRKKPAPKFSKKYFLNHPIYDYFSFNLIRLRNIDFGNSGKSDAIKDMLYLMLTNYHAKIREFINEGVNISDKFDFKKLVHNTILMAEQEYEQEWRKLKINLLEELIRDYNTWHAQSAAFARMAICNITNSEIYDDVSERMQEILGILETKFRVTMPDIEKGLTEANGKYKELKYKSIYF